MVWVKSKRKTNNLSFNSALGRKGTGPQTSKKVPTSEMIAPRRPKMEVKRVGGYCPVSYYLLAR